MAVNGNQKGKRGEREFAELLRLQGFEGARRGQQFAGGNESPDVVCKELAGFHFEVKRGEGAFIGKLGWDALEQANRDREDFQIPVVAHRKNKGKWVVIMEAEDLLHLIRELYQRVKHDG